MHKPVTPGTVCVKKYFSNGTFTPEECHMFKKIDFRPKKKNKNVSQAPPHLSETPRITPLFIVSKKKNK